MHAPFPSVALPPPPPLPSFPCRSCSPPTHRRIDLASLLSPGSSPSLVLPLSLSPPLAAHDTRSLTPCSCVVGQRRTLHCRHRLTRHPRPRRRVWSCASNSTSRAGPSAPCAAALRRCRPAPPPCAAAALRRRAADCCTSGCSLRTCSTGWRTRTAARCNTLQHVATVHHTAARYSTLQQAAAPVNPLQHSTARSSTVERAVAMQVGHLLRVLAARRRESVSRAGAIIAAFRPSALGLRP